MLTFYSITLASVKHYLLCLCSHSLNHSSTFLSSVGGVNAVSWGPDVATGALLGTPNADDDDGSGMASGGSGDVPTMRFVTAGCDNTVRSATGN
jgi:hypothetical protein